MCQQHKCGFPLPVLLARISVVALVIEECDYNRKSLLKPFQSPFRLFQPNATFKALPYMLVIPDSFLNPLDLVRRRLMAKQFLQGLPRSSVNSPILQRRKS